MSLYIERRGRGAPLVLVHGWALHGGIWSGVIDALSAHREVWALDLPGHGASAPPPSYTLDALTAVLAQQLPARADWLGWSLGALVTLAFAQRFPARVGKLALVAATPKFVQSPEWPHGMTPALLQQFAANLARDHAATVARFLSLQVNPGERDTLRTLRAAVASRPAPTPAALTGGLELLRTGDLRAQLGEVVAPTLVLHGARDRLVPPAAGAYLADTLPHAYLHTVDGAAHAPFISHRDEFLSVLNAHWHGQQSASFK